MLRLLKFLTLASLAMSSVTLAATLLPRSFLEARNAALQIVVSESGKTVAFCSGAQVALPGGSKIVSAGHCVEGFKSTAKMWGIDARGRKWRLTLESWEKAWPKNDYATFKPLKSLPSLPVCLEAPSVGEALYSWSGPEGLALFPLSGMYLGAVGDPDPQKGLEGMMLSSQNAAGGASGSAVLTGKGCVIGILVGGFSPSIKLDGALIVPLPQ